ncbi:MAG: FAD-dependent oxidoreductase [Armatimonadetes bacterium]|nr:FAD-dependent oxidoreductase [Anaerolineae bacterium]
MTTVGTPQDPLRVAIIGSGPSGFYAADHLQKQKTLSVQIDMFDRLPTPYGLVRGGVAPDHQKIKSVTKVYDKIASQTNFRFFGNVNFGTDLTHADLIQHYHAVIYAVGAQTDRELGIPGEHLPGSHAATEFVAWYNGHPDFRHLTFDLTQERAAVIGVGNVAMDVTRILARTTNELVGTDIADYALDALAESNVKEVYVLGRRGPAQAAFTNPEIKELGEMEAAEVIVSQRDAALDVHSRAFIESGEDPTATKNVLILQKYADRAPVGKPRRIIFYFLASPVEIIGTERVEAIKIVRNVLVEREGGNLAPKATEETETIPVGLVFRSVGYKGVRLPDVPFNEKSGTIPNLKGRVLNEDGTFRPGDYVVGWIKRGPSGIIGTNKPDSVETAEMLLEDMRANALPTTVAPAQHAIEALLDARGVQVVTFADWQLLDQLELANGAAATPARPRLKFTDVSSMLAALATHKAAQPAGD